MAALISRLLKSRTGTNLASCIRQSSWKARTQAQRAKPSPQAQPDRPKQESKISTNSATDRTFQPNSDRLQTLNSTSSRKASSNKCRLQVDLRRRNLQRTTPPTGSPRPSTSCWTTRLAPAACRRQVSRTSPSRYLGISNISRGNSSNLLGLRLGRVKAIHFRVSLISLTSWAQMHRQTKTPTARPSFLWTMPRSSLLELRNAQLKMVEKRRNGWRHPATNHSLRMFSTMCGQGLNRFKIKLLSKNSHSSKDKARGRMPTNRQRNKLIQVREHKGLPNNNRQIGTISWCNGISNTAIAMSSILSSRLSTIYSRTLISQFNQTTRHRNKHPHQTSRYPHQCTSNQIAN